MSLSPAIRDSLRRISIVRALNATLKARRTKTCYRAWVEYYRARPAPPPRELLLEARVGDRLARIRACSRLHIYFLGTDELQDRSGILQALATLGDLTFFTKQDGEYGQNPKPGRAPESERPANSRALVDDFERLARAGRTPHVLVGQTWGSLIDVEALATIRSRYGTIVVNISMDDRHAYGRGGPQGTHALIPVLDAVATAAPECVEWYLKEGCPAVFFPEASDPRIFHPLGHGEKEHDVAFVGARYGIRDDIVRALREAGVRVSVYGRGWESGPLSVEAVPRLFARSKIVLGVGTIGHCRDMYALKLRDFDGPMSGSLYVTQDNPDLTLLYNVREEIVTYASVDECVRKVIYYLDHDAERNAIAERGHHRARAEHTWEHRFRTLFGQLALPVVRAGDGRPGRPAGLYLQ